MRPRRPGYADRPDFDSRPPTGRGGPPFRQGRPGAPTARDGQDDGPRRPDPRGGGARYQQRDDRYRRDDDDRRPSRSPRAAPSPDRRPGVRSGRPDLPDRRPGPRPTRRDEPPRPARRGTGDPRPPARGRSATGERRPPGTAHADRSDKADRAGKSWGGVARRGAEVVPEGNTASAEWRRAADRARRDTESRHDTDPRHRAGAAPEPWQPERWVRADDQGDHDNHENHDDRGDTANRPNRTAARPNRTAARTARTARAPARKPAPRRKTRPLADDVASGLVDSVGARRAPRLGRDLEAASAAYEAGRFQEASRLLKPLTETVPTLAAVRELAGLSLYRLGRWRAALAELAAYHELTGDVDQYPVVADCERALGHHATVERLIEELRQSSPPPPIMAEGRLVLAGSRADQGRLTDAIAVLARDEADRARPKDWQLRTWYALADLHERAGDVPRARALFERLVRFDADFFDAAERLAALR